MLEAKLDADRISKNEIRLAFVNWMEQLYVAVPDPVMVNYTKSLAPDKGKSWSTVSENRFVKRLLAMHSELGNVGAFCIEGEQYQNLHAHGFVVFSGNTPERALHVRQVVESHMHLSLPKGYAKVEIVRDPDRWINYITKQAKTAGDGIRIEVTGPPLQLQ